MPQLTLTATSIARLLPAACAAVALASTAAAPAATVNFAGTVAVDGFLPVTPGGNGNAPVVGSFTYDPALLPTSSAGDETFYSDPNGSYTLSFGTNGSLGTYTTAGTDSLKLSLFSVTFPEDQTILTVSGFTSGNPAGGVGTRARFSLNLRGIVATLPTAIGEDDLVQFGGAGSFGAGTITDTVGLTSFNIAAVPEPAGCVVIALAGAFALRRRPR